MQHATIASFYGCGEKPPYSAQNMRGLFDNAENKCYICCKMCGEYLMYIYENQKWPELKWGSERILPLLSNVRFKQGAIVGKMGALSFELKDQANLEMLTKGIIKTAEIEGELLNQDQVRSSIARRLGLEVSGLVASDRNVDGIVDMMLDATRNYNKKLNKERLFSWHSSLFPGGYSVKAGLK